MRILCQSIHWPFKLKTNGFELFLSMLSISDLYAVGKTIYSGVTSAWRTKFERKSFKLAVEQSICLGNAERRLAKIDGALESSNSPEMVYIHIYLRAICSHATEQLSCEIAALAIPVLRDLSQIYRSPASASGQPQLISFAKSRPDLTRSWSWSWSWNVTLQSDNTQKYLNEDWRQRRRSKNEFRRIILNEVHFSPSAFSGNPANE